MSSIRYQTVQCPRNFRKHERFSNARNSFAACLITAAYMLLASPALTCSSELNMGQYVSNLGM